METTVTVQCRAADVALVRAAIAEASAAYAEALAVRGLKVEAVLDEGNPLPPTRCVCSCLGTICGPPCVRRQIS